jgi:beta-N-acetylhexosaminidase
MASDRKLLFFSVMIIIVLTGVFFVKQLLYAKKIIELQEELVQETLRSMTKEQKIGQLIHVGMPGKAMSPAILKELQEHYAGGVILFAANMQDKDQLSSLTKSLQEAALDATGIPLLISTDQEGGRVKRVGQWGVEQFPSAMAIGQADEVMLTEAVGFFTGLRLRELGIQVVLAPTLDINNNPENPVINTRSFGSDRAMVVRHGVALDRGLRKSGSLGSIKHFPGHGDTDTDSHLALPIIEKNLKELKEFELIPFEEAILQGAELVMSAHILFPALDKKRPATLSPAIINGLLRTDLGFQGLVITDAMEMDAIDQNYSTERAAVMALQAGSDILLLTSRGEVSDRMFNGVKEAIDSGELSMEQVNQSVLRQLRIKLNRGLFHEFKAPTSLKEKYTDLKEIENLRVEQLNSEIKHYSKMFPAGESQINQIVSELSIKSLQKPFSGLNDAGRKNIIFVTKPIYWKQFCTEAINCVESWGEALKIAGEEAKIIVVPLSKNRLKDWSRKVKTVQNLPITLIGLYDDNPFLEISIPEKGAVLASFSSTKESRAALLQKVISGSAADVANLVSGQTESTFQQDSINEFAP